MGEEILKILLGSGPLAAVLFAALWIVWNRYQDALQEKDALHSEMRDFFRHIIDDQKEE